MIPLELRETGVPWTAVCASLFFLPLNGEHHCS